MAPLTREEELVRDHGLTPAEAEFVAAMERGEVEGDLIGPNRPRSSFAEPGVEGPPPLE